jgi:hypothetical protein
MGPTIPIPIRSTSEFKIAFHFETNFGSVNLLGISAAACSTASLPQCTAETPL